MDNMISGILGAIIFIAFTGGLAQSIGAFPFVFIVILVIILLLVDLTQSIKEGFREEKNGKQD